MKCKKVFHGSSKGRLCRSNRRAVRVFGDALRDWQCLVRAPRRAFREGDRAGRISKRTRRNLVRLTRKNIRPTGTVFASSALCTPQFAIKTDPSANRSRPAANCSARPRGEPRDPQVDPGRPRRRSWTKFDSLGLAQGRKGRIQAGETLLTRKFSLTTTGQKANGQRQAGPGLDWPAQTEFRFPWDEPSLPPLRYHPAWR